MSIPELATPIRIYWDITPLPETPPDHEKIAADIIDLRILVLDITATGSTLPDSCFSILKKCSDAMIGVTLTISPQAFKAAAASLVQTPPKELLFETDNIYYLKALPPLHPSVSGISFPITELNWSQIPEVTRFCSQHSFKRLVFPMQRLYNSETPFHIPASGLSEIASELSSFRPDSTLKITAHDPFVWRAIFPDKLFPEGRCQAANTMLAIDQHGTVFPCPVMPVPLGNLEQVTLKEIARGEHKRILRSKLLRLPKECECCNDAEKCKGGCRGRGESVFGTWDAIDPGCR